MFDGKLARRETDADAFVPYSNHVAPDTMLLDGGSVLGGFRIVGKAWETADPDEVQGWHTRLAQTLRTIASDRIVLTTHVVRTLADRSEYPVGAFRSTFSRDLDAAYRERMLDRRLYKNELYLFVLVQPFVDSKAAWLPAWLKRNASPESSEDLRGILADTLRMIEADLADYGLSRLGLRREGRALYSEIAEALHTVLTTERRKVPLVTGRISRSIYTDRIFVGWEAIEIRGLPRSKYASALVMYEYPAETWPGMLSNLLAAPYSCVLTQSFAYLAKAIASGIITRKQNQMTVGGDKALSQRDGLTQAANDLAGNAFVLGTHHLSLVVFAESMALLPKVAAQAMSDMADCGARPSHAHLELAGAYLSQLPGNMKFRPRPGAISSRNFAALAPLHDYPRGAEEGYWGPPLALFRTNGGTGYRYHPHLGDLGNTFITGPSGAGKTTLIGMILSQAEKTGAQIVLFDKDRGLEIACRAMGGTYLVLPNGVPTGCAPLKALTGSGEDISFLASLVRALIVAGSDYELTAEDDRRILVGLKALMRLPPQARSFGELRAFLGVTDPNGAGARLQRWCAGQKLGWVLDCDVDLVSLAAPVLGFDMTSVLDHADARGPLMGYLFHRCEELIDGRRVVFAIDEFWRALLDPGFRDLVHDKLKTLRKRNAPMFLATQSPRDALSSSIAHTIVEQCPNAFHCANPRASEEDYIAGLKLTEPEFLQIKEGMVSGGRRYLLKQGTTSVVVDLDLSASPDLVAVLSGRESTVRLMERLIASYGDDPDAWLPHFYSEWRSVSA